MWPSSPNNQVTVTGDCENTKKIQFQIRDVEKSWLTFQQKLRTYLLETFDEATKEVINSQYITRKEAYENLLLEAKDQHCAATQKVEILMIKQHNLFSRLKSTLDIVEESIQG